MSKNLESNAASKILAQFKDAKKTEAELEAEGQQKLFDSKQEPGAAAGSVTEPEAKAEKEETEIEKMAAVLVPDRALKRGKHISLAMRQKTHDELKEIAKSQGITLTALINGMLENQLAIVKAGLKKN